jgi:hypothetical protein
MKYKSDIPNLFIMGDKAYENGTRDRVELGQFDKNGNLETNDTILIQRLKELGYTPIEDVKKATNNENECKKCGQKFANKGELMAHYRKDHPRK